MIKTFDNEINCNNIEVGSFCVYNVNSVKIGQGGDGFLIKLNLLDNFLNYYNVIKEEDFINYHDDFYISYYFYLLNKNIEFIKPPNNCLIYDIHDSTFIDALSKLNGKYSRGNLNHKLYEILETFKINGYFNL
jgi:hypothetical protein